MNAMNGLNKTLKSLEELDANEEMKVREEVQTIITKCPQILQISSLCFKDSESHIRQAKPMVRCDDSIEINDLIHQVINKKWKLLTPRIVVVILSNCGPINNWTNKQQIKSFQKGLMKAAESTEMWLIANGIDMGSTTMIGDGINDYLTQIKYKKAINSEKCFSKSNFIGLVDEDLLKYQQTIIKSDNSKIMIGSEGKSLENILQKYELNQNLTHYLLIKDQTRNKSGVNKFLDRLVNFLSVNQTLTQKSAEKVDISSLVSNEVPIVSILIKGGYECSALVLNQIKNGFPVVVLRGTGGLADLLAFAYTEIGDRCMNVWNPDFVESYLKPELTLRIVETFEDLRENSLLCNTFRNRILDAIRESRIDGQNYLTIINMLDTYSCNLENLTEYLLSALFRSQRNERPDPVSSHLQPSRDRNANQIISVDLIRKDLSLCVDWNCPEVAKTQVLSKDPTFKLLGEKLLFEESLTRQNRWQFVDLFLSQKFKLRSFVSLKRLKRMYRSIHKENFFQTVCWQSILGRTSNQRQSDVFVLRELNWLIQACTGVDGFVDEDELYSFVIETPLCTEKEAERKSLELIVFWAIMDFRKKLVKILWSHSDQPIHLALLIAMSYDRLSWYVTDQQVTDQLKKESELFVSYACDVLDAIYKDNADRAEQVLNESSIMWNNRTAMDLAAFGKFKTFFIHPSCQRRLSNQIYGNILVKDVRIGVCRIPSMFKLLLSAYLVFPMYLWIRVVNYQPLDQSLYQNLAKEEEEENIRLSAEMKKNKPNIHTDKPTARRNKSLKNVWPDSPDVSPPLHVLVYETWTAPITKFWNFQFFYTFYLSIFSVAVLYPRCGNYYLDLVVAVWTSLIVIDKIRQTYLIYLRNRSHSSMTRIVEICLQIAFVIYFSWGRIIQWDSHHTSAYIEKVVMCLALLHAYYVLFTVFLPISATLGPLLYRLKIMIFVDFLNFIRLSILIMISFGVVLQAVLYPDLGINFELFRSTTHRAFFAMFQSFANELEVDPNCEEKFRWDNPYNPVYKEGNIDRCTASVYSDEQCRVTGWWPYMFAIAYFILLKLILMTLLYAIFASSATKMTADTNSIWKAQRYGLVMDFVTRAPMPPPLNVFYYIYWIFNLFCRSCNPNDKNTNKESTLLADEDYTYLRILAAQVYERREAQLEYETLPFQQWERNKANAQELEYQRKMLRQLKGKVSEMDRSIHKSLVYLETIKHLSVKQIGSDRPGTQTIHLLSRHSPYPSTTVQRYPVPDKYVSWDAMWVDYDPITYTKPVNDFGVQLQDLADSDILLIMQQNNKPYHQESNEDKHSNLPKFDWNRLSGATVTIDRSSWQMQDNKQLVYRLDNGIPLNPIGRTGLKGRGSLLRWGPNHYIMTVITRAKSSNLVEVLIDMLDSNSPFVSLIEGFISGEKTYVAIESHFKTDVSVHKKWLTSETMTEFFKSLDENNATDTPPDGQPIQPNLKFERLSIDYFDDPLNTDNAWKELELWHFHYTNQYNVLNHYLKDTTEWREVNESLFCALSLSHSKVIQDIMNKLDASLH